jgi:hypothetical protein
VRDAGLPALLFVAFVGACGTPLSAVRLTPTAVATAPAEAPQAQVRLLGFTVDDPTQYGVTVDLGNPGPAPLEIDLAATTLDFASALDQDRRSLRPVSAGQGELPARVPRTAVLRPILVPPGRSVTAWILFERQPLPRTPLVTLELAFRGRVDRAAVVINDPRTDIPAWHSARTSGLALMARGVAQDYDRHGLLVAPLSLGLTYARGPFKVGAAAGLATLYQHAGALYERADGPIVEASAAWRPLTWPFGPYVAAQLCWLDFPSDSIIADRWSSSFSAGLEAPFFPGFLPALALRVGYVRALDTRSGLGGGLAVSFEGRAWLW